MKNHPYYEKLFDTYSDVVTLPKFREMLGGMGYTTARKLMSENHVQHFCIRHTYLIPKASVIDYLLSKHYTKYKRELKVQV